jgi:hypothetical protein
VPDLIVRVAEIPEEAERLLAVAPESFVDERKALAKTLRDDGRSDEAAAVAAMRKPSAVVSAVNRAARDRPKAAQSAADAATALRDAQAGGDADAFSKAAADLDGSLDMLAEVALAHVSPRGKEPSDAMRRRLRDLLRSAVADDDSRERLIRGALAEEIDASGFSAYAGLAIAPKQRGGKKEAARESRSDAVAERRREREKKLRADLADAEEELRDAGIAARSAERARERAEKAVAALRKKLESS